MVQTGAFQVALVVKKLSAYAGDLRDRHSIPGWERSPEGMATHSSILAWRVLWTEEPGRLQSTGHKELDTTEATEHPAHILFPMVVVPIYIPINSGGESPLLHILSSIYCLSFWMTVILTEVT